MKEAIARMGWALLGVGLCGAGISIGACSANSDSGNRKLGSTCASGNDCDSNNCLAYNEPTDQNVAGLCTTPCTASTDCGKGGACARTDSSGFSMYCAQTCTSSSQCAAGVPCSYDEAAGTGICTAIVSSLCMTLATGANSCAACLAAHCCAQLRSCVADYACGKAFAGDSSSSNAGYTSLLQCSATPCASQCGGTLGTGDGGTD
ncbi:MAG: hypothetical protein ACRENE_13905 [Polyangiaceae bacterium]